MVWPRGQIKSTEVSQWLKRILRIASSETKAGSTSLEDARAQ